MNSATNNIADTIEFQFRIRLSAKGFKVCRDCKHESFFRLARTISIYYKIEWIRKSSSNLVLSSKNTDYDGLCLALHVHASRMVKSCLVFLSKSACWGSVCSTKFLESLSLRAGLLIVFLEQTTKRLKSGEDILDQSRDIYCRYTTRYGIIRCGIRRLVFTGFNERESWDCG